MTSMTKLITSNDLTEFNKQLADVEKNGGYIHTESLCMTTVSGWPAWSVLIRTADPDSPF